MNASENFVDGTGCEITLNKSEQDYGLKYELYYFQQVGLPVNSKQVQTKVKPIERWQEQRQKITRVTRKGKFTQRKLSPIDLVNTPHDLSFDHLSDEQSERLQTVLDYCETYADWLRFGRIGDSPVLTFTRFDVIVADSDGNNQFQQFTYDPFNSTWRKHHPKEHATIDPSVYENAVMNAISQFVELCSDGCYPDGSFSYREPRYTLAKRSRKRSGKVIPADSQEIDQFVQWMENGRIGPEPIISESLQRIPVHIPERIDDVERICDDVNHLFRLCIHHGTLRSLREARANTDRNSDASDLSLYDDVVSSSVSTIASRIVSDAADVWDSMTSRQRDVALTMRSRGISASQAGTLLGIRPSSAIKAFEEVCELTYAKN